MANVETFKVQDSLQDAIGPHAHDAERHVVARNPLCMQEGQAVKKRGLELTDPAGGNAPGDYLQNLPASFPLSPAPTQYTSALEE
jgi:hypothetical protein